MEERLFEELAKLEIPIFFIITKYRYNPKKKTNDIETENAREQGRKKFKKVIKQKFKSIFLNKNKKKKNIKHLNINISDLSLSI